MQLVTKKEQLITNIETVENYLSSDSEPETSFIRDLIKNGNCFVAYTIGKELRFAPSRFLGYINNTYKKHEQSKKSGTVDGRDTNPAISKAISSRLRMEEKLEKEYHRYCNSLGILPKNYDKRKFWPLILGQDFKENTLVEGEFPEGKIVERIHKKRERNATVIELAKRNFKLKNKGKIFCQACGFDFKKKYGKLGEDFIEGHHIIPVSEMKEGHVTKPEEIALLCSNCHRMVHKRRPWLSMDSLKLLVKPDK